ncbi:hypothetical protein BD410DRAFT_785633 [Rickenella mellea]|uniref:Uncharacterized protein n=1 Tax=Rickenella mellea TaxID=50990 RepID=A0A4Y7QB57_9AGAM|nr:hypothetical protein BD410DRAFT_785633 [Rickenella mellea]
MFSRLHLASLLFPLFHAALADISLFIPGFDEQPLSASEIGAGPDGRTTYEIAAGAPTSTFDSPDFLGTATLVVGPSDAFVTYAQPDKSIDFGDSCTITGTLAVCVVTDQTTTETSTETVSPFLVQGGVQAVNTAASSTPSPTTINPSGFSMSTRSGPSSPGVTSTSSPATSFGLLTISASIMDIGIVVGLSCVASLLGPF